MLGLEGFPPCFRILPHPLLYPAGPGVVLKAHRGCMAEVGPWGVPWGADSELEASGARGENPRQLQPRVPHVTCSSGLSLAGDWSTAAQQLHGECPSPGHGVCPTRGIPGSCSLPTLWGMAALPGALFLSQSCTFGAEQKLPPAKGEAGAAPPTPTLRARVRGEARNPQRQLWHSVPSV